MGGPLTRARARRRGLTWRMAGIYRMSLKFKGMRLLRARLRHRGRVVRLQTLYRGHMDSLPGTGPGTPPPSRGPCARGLRCHLTSSRDTAQWARIHELYTEPEANEIEDCECYASLGTTAGRSCAPRLLHQRCPGACDALPPHELGTTPAENPCASRITASPIMALWPPISCRLARLPPPNRS